MRLDTQEVFISVEDKTGRADGVEAERIEGEAQVAVHVLSNEDTGPLCSAYLDPVDAALLGGQLIEAAREATKGTPDQ